jgi:hypothetical protein
MKLKLISALHDVAARLDSLGTTFEQLTRMVIRAEDKDGFIRDVTIHQGLGDSMTATAHEIIDVMRAKFYRDPIEAAIKLEIVVTCAHHLGSFSIEVKR